jgi:hypothetical protein
MSSPISEGDLKEVVNAIVTGRKIEAIKLYRQYSGLGLKQAKDAVEELEKKLQKELPGIASSEGIAGKQQGTKSTNAVPGVQAGKGCLGMLAVIILAVTILLLVTAFS